jgi:hypothetical protein
VLACYVVSVLRFESPIPAMRRVLRAKWLFPIALALLGCSSSGSTGAPNPSSGAGNGAAGSASNPSGGAPNGGSAPSTGGVGDASAGASSGGAGNGGAAGTLAMNGGMGGVATGGAAGTAGGEAWRVIAPGTSWQWQLTDTLDTSFNVQVYDIDLFDNDAAAVSALHQKGVQVICYVSVGSYEDWRPDAADFPAAVLGKDYPGWPGEKFLDIRALDTLGPIMEKRFDLCKSKGFDGLEPDNMDVFEGGNAGTGFPLTQRDGLAYAQWLTTQAHARGLSIGQKNTSELAMVLAPSMDWALTEDCFNDNWCADMQPYIDHGKAVLMSEYTDTGVNFGDACTWAKAHQFSAILKGRDLDAPVQFCP